MTKSCSCDGPGFCNRYNMHVLGRHYELCAGINCSEEDSESYRKTWDQRAKDRKYPTPIVYTSIDSGKISKIKLTMLRYKKWRRARKVWKDAGRPKRTTEQQVICIAICESCEYHTGKGKYLACGICGCWARDGVLFRGKISMATEKCPADKWPALDAEREIDVLRTSEGTTSRETDK